MEKGENSINYLNFSLLNYFIIFFNKKIHFQDYFNSKTRNFNKKILVRVFQFSTFLICPKKNCFMLLSNWNVALFQKLKTNSNMPNTISKKPLHFSKLLWKRNHSGNLKFKCPKYQKKWKVLSNFFTPKICVIIIVHYKLFFWYKKRHIVKK